MPWVFLTVGGLSASLSSLIILILLGNRQNWRQLNGIRNQLTPKPPKAVKKADAEVINRANRTTEQKKLVLPKIGAAYEHVHRVHARRSDYETFALRSRSVLIRDSFALAATDNELDYEDLTRFVSAHRLGMLNNVEKTHLQKWNRTAFLALARIQVNQRILNGDLDNSIRYFEFAESALGASFKPTDRLLYLEALGDLDRFEEQARLAKRFKLADKYPMQAKLLSLNAIQHRSSAASTDWLRELNPIYTERGLSAVTLLNYEDLSPFDRLHTNPAAIQKGPLVSVIVPTFQGGPTLLTALDSLLQQTWDNLEIIVVDDGSGPEYQQYLDQAVALSPKISLIKQPENLGAYCARNAGVAAATGEFVTVHDDDDWSHSDKIATQVQHLINNPDLLGNMSAHVRATEELKLVRINVKPILTQPNFSSLMVRRSVFGNIGVWDEVNKGADSEFRDRLEKYSGKLVPVLDEVPLGFTRTRDSSLTAGEVSRGYVAPNRRLYLKAFTQWHESVGNPSTPIKPSGERAFPVPSTMAPGKRDQDLGTFDVVFMTDFRFPGGTTALTLAELRTAAAAGYRVGFIHEESPINRSDHPISEKLLDLQSQGVVEQVALEDSAHIRLLAIRHPVVVQFMDTATSKLRVKQATIIVNNPPLLSDGSGMVFDLPTCTRNVDRLFDLESLVIAESGVTKQLCEGLIPKKRLSELTWPGLITPTEVSPPDFTRRPIVGRHSRDHELKWPSTKEIFDAVYTSSEYDTHILGGVDTLVSKLGSRVLLDKTVYEFGARDVDKFLDEIDFWVYFHDERLTESFGMAIAEAMASGKVVILPPYLRATFGEGALYAEPAQVESLVLRVWKDPSRYREQSERAKAYVEKHFSGRAFLKRIKKLTPGASSIGSG